MAASEFPDKTHRPTDTDLSRVLGTAQELWVSLLSGVEAEGTAMLEWKHYASSGWLLVLRGKRKNVAYLRPLAGGFLVSLAFGDAAVEAAGAAGLPDALVDAIRVEKKYAEGRAARVEVRTARDLAVAERLLAIKLAHG